MIKILGVEAQLRPVIICDVCQKQIEEVNLAAVVMADPIGLVDGATADCLHAHKDTCLDAAEARLGGRENAGWHELRYHLVELLYGLGIDEARFKAIVEQKREMGGMFGG